MGWLKKYWKFLVIAAVALITLIAAMKLGKASEAKRMEIAAEEKKAAEPKTKAGKAVASASSFLVAMGVM